MVEKQLGEIIKECMDIDISKFSEEEKNYPLLSARLGGLPYQMLALLIKVERLFDIKIDNQKIADGKFNTYNNILTLIKDKLECKANEKKSSNY